MSTFIYSGLGGLTGGALITACAAIKFDSSGNLYAGGRFTAAGGVLANNIARWNGSAWSALGSGLTGATFTGCYAIEFDSAGNLYAGGEFTSPATRIARWNGSTWSALGTGLNNTCEALGFSNGILYAGGAFTAPGNYIAKWDGTRWTSLLGGLNNTCHVIAFDSFGDLYAGGNFTLPGNFIAKWTGSAWTILSTGLSGGIISTGCYAIALDSLNNVYAGGDFTQAGSTSVNHIAKWNGSTWSALGTGLLNSSSSTPCTTIAVNSQDNVYAGGNFTTAGGVSANRIAKFNNVTLTWSALGSGLNDTCSVCTFQSLNLYIGGIFTTPVDRIGLIQEVIPSTSYLYKINNNSVYQCFFPVGCLLAYIGTQSSGSAGYDPDGWLVCDGRTIGNQIPANSKYDALTTFLDSNTLPNLQGAFLRGAGTYDANRIGPALKKFQTDTFKSHLHTYIFGLGDTKGGNGNTRRINGLTNGNTSTTTFSTITNNAVVSSNTDTRPINYGVKWIIKY